MPGPVMTVTHYPVSPLGVGTQIFVSPALALNSSPALGYASSYSTTVQTHLYQSNLPVRSRIIFEDRSTDFPEGTIKPATDTTPVLKPSFSPPPIVSYLAQENDVIETIDRAEHGRLLAAPKIDGSNDKLTNGQSIEILSSAHSAVKAKLAQISGSQPNQVSDKSLYRFLTLVSETQSEAEVLNLLENIKSSELPNEFKFELIGYIGQEAMLTEQVFDKLMEYLSSLEWNYSNYKSIESCIFHFSSNRSASDEQMTRFVHLILNHTTTARYHMGVTFLRSLRIDGRKHPATFEKMFGAVEEESKRKNWDPNEFREPAFLEAKLTVEQMRRINKIISLWSWVAALIGYPEEEIVDDEMIDYLNEEMVSKYGDDLFVQSFFYRYHPMIDDSFQVHLKKIREQREEELYDFAGHNQIIVALAMNPSLTEDQREQVLSWGLESVLKVVTKYDGMGVAIDEHEDTFDLLIDLMRISSSDKTFAEFKRLLTEPFEATPAEASKILISYYLPRERRVELENLLIKFDLETYLETVAKMRARGIESATFERVKKLIL